MDLGETFRPLNRPSDLEYVSEMDKELIHEPFDIPESDEDQKKLG